MADWWENSTSPKIQSSPQTPVYLLPKFRHSGPESELLYMPEKWPQWFWPQILVIPRSRIHKKYHIRILDSYVVKKSEKMQISAVWTLIYQSEEIFFRARCNWVSERVADLEKGGKGLSPEWKRERERGAKTRSLPRWDWDNGKQRIRGSNNNTYRAGLKSGP